MLHSPGMIVLIQWVTNVLRHLGHLALKFDFLESWTHFSPSHQIIILFLRLHRPERLHNIELG